MSNVVWNVDSQRGYLGLDHFHWGLRGAPSLFLVTRQDCESDLDVCAGETEDAPLR